MLDGRVVDPDSKPGKTEDDIGMASTNASDDGVGPGGPLVSTVPASSLMSEERGLRPLLKASPPMPVGSYVGRYRVRIWRASARQTFGINFKVSENIITIGEDLPHLGLRQHDELVSVNGRKAVHVDECRRLLGESLSIDMVLQHREMEEVMQANEGVSCTWSLFGASSGSKTAAPQSGGGGCSDPWCFTRQQTGGPVQPLRVLLSATPPATVPVGMTVANDEDGGVEFEVTLQRASLRQRFGMNFAFEPQLPSLKNKKAPRILISEDCYPTGLIQDDVVLAVNGVTYERAAECQKILERAMTVTMRLKRLSNADGYPQIAMPAEILNVGDEIIEVIHGTDRPCESPFCVS